MKQSLNIAITGGIGAGKSSVICQLQSDMQNVTYRSIDDAVKLLYEHAAWNDWLECQFGTCVKSEISAMAFSNPSVREQIMDKSAKFIDDVLASWLKTDGINVIEYPMLFEFKQQNLFDIVILITAPDSVRISRVMARDEKSKSAVEKIMATQMSESEKRLRADLVIDTTIDTPREAADRICVAIKEGQK